MKPFAVLARERAEVTCARTIEKNSRNGGRATVVLAGPYERLRFADTV
jgi:hypothetical protein